jgi:hypothetical protein
MVKIRGMSIWEKLLSLSFVIGEYNLKGCCRYEFFFDLTPSLNVFWVVARGVGNDPGTPPLVYNREEESG